MKAAALLAHYARVAEAPDAIARLRQFVLDLAVRGKLVSQEAGMSRRRCCSSALSKRKAD
ncbi:hypothetical protein ACFQY5_36030 [Paeniroseomonas aquatica]|uniref:hypothetical protein n=1 Tax=Paeniroseomonas aquatica TaxID=373043 RepID=UPI00360AE9A7